VHSFQEFQRSTTSGFHQFSINFQEMKEPEDVPKQEKKSNSPKPTSSQNLGERE